MELYHGSPDNMEGRQDREIRSYKLLDELGVDFVRTDHFDEPATTMEACEKIDAILNVKICKNLLLCNRQKTNFYLLIMPGDKPFKYLKLLPGSVSVLGLMNDHGHKVRLLIDEDLLEEAQFGCHPCVNTSSIRFSTRDLFDRVLPAMGVTYTTVQLVGY